MNEEPYFFEIPVYRCDQKAHHKELKLLDSKFINQVNGPISPEKKKSLLETYQYHIHYTWSYNEVIGWICLYIMGHQVRGDYYFDSAKRMNKGIRKKKYKYYGKAFEKTMNRNMNSNEIYDSILEVFKFLEKDVRKLKNRYIDLDKFKVVGKFIDWKKLMFELNRFNHIDN